MGSLRYEGNRLWSDEEEVAYTSDMGGSTTGTNENGSWTKFGDGTMVCWGVKEGMILGQVISHYILPIPFPEVFSDFQDLTVTFTPLRLYAPGGDPGAGHFVTSAIKSLNSQLCELDLFTDALWQAGDQETVHWVAMGRWRTIV